MYPSRQLSQIAREFRHLQAEHEREGHNGSWRRRQGARLGELERQFDLLLARWVEDPAECERWREHLHRGAAAPEPSAEETTLFEGRSELGRTIQIRALESGERIVLLDGARVDHVAAEIPVESPFRFGDSLYQETSDSPPEALEALAAFVSRAAREPPWRWARTLLSDGLIDSSFALTERGRRMLR